MSDFISWETLGTLAGMVAIVNLIVQVSKNYLPEVNPKWLSLITATLIMVIYTLVSGEITVEKLFLAVINIFLVVSTATGTYKHIIEPVEEAISKE